MKFQIFSPPAHLKDFVRCYWTLESSGDSVPPKEYQSMADGFGELIFQYRGGFEGLKNRRSISGRRNQQFSNSFYPMKLKCSVSDFIRTPFPKF
jgi:hypothetical protein